MPSDKIGIKITKRKKQNLKPVKDGPHVRDIKISKNKGPAPALKETRSRIVKIKDENLIGSVEEKKRKFHFKSFILGLIFILLGLSFVVILGFYFWQDFFSGQNKIIKMIPQNAVFYARADLKKFWNGSEKQNIQKLAAKFLAGGDLEKAITTFLNEKIFAQYKLEFGQDIKPQMGKEAALALIPEKKEKGENLSAVLIFEINNNEKIKEIFSNLKEAEISEISLDNVKINLISFPENKLNFYYVILDRFLVLGKNKEPLFKVAKVFQNQNLSLASFKKFRETVPFWSRNALFYSYLNFSETSKEILGESKILTKSANFLPLFVFLKRMESFSLSVDFDENGIYFGGFTPYKNKNSKSLAMLDYLPNETAISFSGSDLKKEWLSFSDILKKEDPVAGFYLKNFEKKLSEEYKITLEKDIFPFIEKEFAIVLLNDGGKQNLGLILELTDQEKIKDSMKAVENAISHYYGLIYPKEKKMALADGTEAIELFPDDKSFQFKEEKFSTESGEDISIKNIENPKVPNPFAFAFFDNKLIFGTSKDVVEKIISQRLGKKGLASNFELSESKKKAGAGKNVNGLVYINWAKVFETLGWSEQKRIYLEPLKNFVLVSKGKNNGTAISGFLLIK